MNRFEHAIHTARREEGELSVERLRRALGDDAARHARRLGRDHRRLPHVVVVHPALHRHARLRVRVRVRAAARAVGLRAVRGARAPTSCRSTSTCCVRADRWRPRSSASSSTSTSPTPGSGTAASTSSSAASTRRPRRRTRPVASERCPRATSRVISLTSSTGTGTTTCDRPRRLSDAEYFWEPVDGCWSICTGRARLRPRGRSTPVGERAPFTTIAWRLGHIAGSVWGWRVAGHFEHARRRHTPSTWQASNGPATPGTPGSCSMTQYRRWQDAASPRSTTAAFDGAVRPGRGTVRLRRRSAALVLHINREVIHHGAEILTVRDLYAARKVAAHDLSRDPVEHRQRRRGRAAVHHRAIPSSSSSACGCTPPTRRAGTRGSCAASPPTGVLATNDADALLALDADCVSYTATADLRPTDAIADMARILRRARTSCRARSSPLVCPAHVEPAMRAPLEDACADAGVSCFTSGIDPGWANDLLPLVAHRHVRGRRARCA